MALGFNQAGLIFATSRKATVERRAMNLTNDKLALSRESDNISDEYQQAQNLRKLVVENSEGKQTDLTYNSLVGAFNLDTGSYAVTDGIGRMVLTTAQATKLGLMDNNGNYSGLYEGTRTEFLENQINPYTGVRFNAAAFQPGKRLGIEYAEAAALRKYTAVDIDNADILATSRVNFNLQLLNLASTVGIVGPGSSVFDNGLVNCVEALGAFGTAVDPILQIVQNIYDTASTELEKLGYRSDQIVSDSEPKKAQIEKYQEEVKQTEDLVTRLTGIQSLCTSAYEITSNDDDAKKKTQLYAAAILSMLGYAGEGVSVGSLTMLVSQDSYTSINKAVALSLIKSVDSKFATKLVGGTTVPSKTVETMLAEVDSAFTRAATDNATILSHEDGSGGEGWDKNVYYQMPPAPDDSQLTEADYAEYYDTVWKHLSQIGYVIDDGVYDNNYFEQCLRQGKYFVEQQMTEESYAFSRVNWEIDGTLGIVDIKSTDEINIAQIKYENAKERLDRKESMIDVEIQKLNTERTALDTQIDSIKSIISKNNERNKMFQA